MKYVVAWTTRQSVSEEQQERGLAVFANWQPAEDATFLQFVGRIDGHGGYAVVETDDPTVIAKDMATFNPFFEFKVHPVLDIQQTAEIANQAVAERKAIS